MTYNFTQRRIALLAGMCLALLLGPTDPSLGNLAFETGGVVRAAPALSSSFVVPLLGDDLMPQPYQGDPIYYYNRLEGDRGAVGNASLVWGRGQVTATISGGGSWGGGWTSLNHPIREGLPINFSAALPSQILPTFQTTITKLTVTIARGTPGRAFKLELKDGSTVRWSIQAVLSGGPQILDNVLPPLGNINQLVWFMDGAAPGDFVVVKRISFDATTTIPETPMRVFVWSYGMLLNNWNPSTGLVREKAKDASGEFDAIPSTGALAAATAIAKQLGVVSQADATQIVNKIGRTLLVDVPRYHGLWPHWVTVSNTGAIAALQTSEWSSVDTAIAALSLLEAQTALGLDTSSTVALLQVIDWNDLQKPTGISHGYDANGTQIPYVWDTFGGESWLVELTRSIATGSAPNHIAYPDPPTANGSGFIDELAWLFVPPPPIKDFWGNDWNSYRQSAADVQLSQYPKNYPTSCFNALGLFGLSAAEVPAPSLVAKGSIYQAFGVGARWTGLNDGATILGAPVVVPHYSAMIASLHFSQATNMWTWLISQGYFSPLNNVESLMFAPVDDCNTTPSFNQLKGSWNLALQSLGWGRALAQNLGQTPVLWNAAMTNMFIRRGWDRLVPPLYLQYLPVITVGRMAGH